MFAHDLDDEAALGLPLAIFNYYIAFFHGCVFLSGRVNYPTFEYREESLQTLISLRIYQDWAIWLGEGQTLL